jgi:hypothetical protein
LVGKLEGNRPLRRSVPRLKGINKMDLKSMVDVGMNLFVSLACSYDDNATLGFISCWGFLNSWYLSAAEEGLFSFFIKS